MPGAYIRLRGHALREICTTTIARDGAKVATGSCSCGWSTEQTFAREVRDAYRRHVRAEIERSFPTLKG